MRSSSEALPERFGVRPAVAGCGTPNLLHSKARLDVREVNPELVLDIHAINLHFHNPLIKRRRGVALERSTAVQSSSWLC